MKKITYDEFTKCSEGIVFLTTPFCGVCQTTRRLLEILEASETVGSTIMELEHVYLAKLAQEYQVTHVPALIYIQNVDGQQTRTVSYECLTLLDIISEVKEDMNIPKKGDRVQVQCYKHDSSFHRSWEKLDIIYADETTIIGVNNSTKVYESNGYFWKTKEPAVSYFRTDKWFNIICMIREDGIYYYCNLSSPIVYDIRTLKYIDYDLDIKVYPDGSYDIVDQNEYAYHKKKMKYPADIGWILTHQIQELESWIQNKLGPFDTRNVHRWYKEYTKLNPKTYERFESHIGAKSKKLKQSMKGNER